MANPSGKIIEITYKSVTSEKVLTFWSSLYLLMELEKVLRILHLRTADSGYLTRRLVDVSQDVIVREEIVVQIEGLKLSEIKDGNEVIES